MRREGQALTAVKLQFINPNLTHNLNPSASDDGDYDYE